MSPYPWSSVTIRITLGRSIASAGVALSSVNIVRQHNHGHIRTRICFMNQYPESKLTAIPHDWQAIGVPAIIDTFLTRLFDFDSHRPVRWVNLTGRLPEPPHKAPFLTHFAAGGGEVSEIGKREWGSSL